MGKRVVGTWRTGKNRLARLNAPGSPAAIRYDIDGWRHAVEAARDGAGCIRGAVVFAEVADGYIARGDRQQAPMRAITEKIQAEVEQYADLLEALAVKLARFADQQEARLKARPAARRAA